MSRPVQTSLLLDIGNSRAKWALADADGCLHACGSAAHQGTDVWIEKLPAVQPQAVWVANVAAVGHIDALAQAARERWGLCLQVAQTTAFACGVRNGYAQPRQLGVDRWLACIGAHHFQPAAPGLTLIVDVGTALTLDWVGADGVHQGGLITTGVHATRQAIRGKTQIRAQQRDVSASWAACDTDSAVALGTLRTASSLITAACAARRPDRVLLTGGEASLLVPRLPVDCVQVPTLVLRGLAQLVLEQR